MINSAPVSSTRSNVVESDDNESSISSEEIESKREAFCRAALDLLLFYTTAFFVLLAILSVFALIFLVPFFIDPAWSTLQADFHPNGTTCTTISGRYLEGKSHCEWTSCQEGCTQTIYTCWQVRVEYEIPGVDVGLGVHRAPREEGNLLSNVKGCGYPPRIVCSDFVDRYAKNGSVFTCYVSRVNPSMVIVNLDLEQVHRELFFSLAIPIPCLIISIVYILIAYFYIYPDPPHGPYKPVAPFSTISAMAAMVDVAGLGGGAASGVIPQGGGNESAAEQRRRLIMQAQRAKMLAAAGKAPNSALLRCSAVAKATASMVPSMVAGGANDYVTAPRRSREKPEDKQAQKVQEFRREYGKEKYSVMQYYQYYGIL